MAILAIEGMHFFCFHGCYKEERKDGGNFIVDVWIDIPDEFGISDDLTTTLNYVEVYEICQTIMNEPAFLIESLAHKILMKLKNQFPTIIKFTVKVSKLNPPLAGEVDSTSIKISG